MREFPWVKKRSQESIEIDNFVPPTHHIPEISIVKHKMCKDGEQRTDDPLEQALLSMVKSSEFEVN